MSPARDHASRTKRRRFRWCGRSSTRITMSCGQGFPAIGLSNRICSPPIPTTAGAAVAIQSLCRSDLIPRMQPDQRIPVFPSNQESQRRPDSCRRRHGEEHLRTTARVHDAGYADPPAQGRCKGSQHQHRTAIRRDARSNGRTVGRANVPGFAPPPTPSQNQRQHRRDQRKNQEESSSAGVDQTDDCDPPTQHGREPRKDKKAASYRRPVQGPSAWISIHRRSPLRNSLRCLHQSTYPCVWRDPDDLLLCGHLPERGVHPTARRPGPRGRVLSGRDHFGCFGEPARH